MICLWKFLGSPPETLVANGKSFAQADSSTCDFQLNQLPPKVVIGDNVNVKISQAAYEAGLEQCKGSLHGRFSIQKGDLTFTTKSLNTKLTHLWPNLKPWPMIPLGKGLLEF